MVQVEDKIIFKTKLFTICRQMLEERIAKCRSEVNNAQALANEEEKSSAGDKYETGRAMSHREKDMFSKQAAANESELAALLSVDSQKIYTSIQPGAAIICDDCTFFIATGLGKISMDDKTVFLLSPFAPFAKMLSNKRRGDLIILNSKEIIIKDIF
ncbi:MAG: hypothetical protein ABIP80_01220 [Ferruginibacter sp.]